MSKVKNVLSRSLAMSSYPEGAEQRLQTLRRIPNPMKRAACLALHGAATKYPSVVGAYVGVRANALRDQAIIAAGTDAIVIRESADTVLKLHTKSIALNAEELKSFVQQIQEDHGAMAERMGTLVLQQRSFAASHPAVRSRQVAQSRQAYRSVDDPGIFQGEQVIPSQRALDTLAQSHPDSFMQLKEFVTRSFALYDETGLVPDTCGEKNLVIDLASDSLLLIDGLPLTRENRHVQMQALAQIDNLGSVLDNL